ncbi:hypothetical protein ACSBR2_039912 [Camellia fascicularis]
MNRIQVKKNEIGKYCGLVYPTVQQKLESKKENARNCFASFAGDLKFEVNCYDTTHTVDLREKPEASVHNYFSNETYLRTHSFMINVVPREHDWIEVGYDAIAPLYYRKLAGRPRKERKKAVDEPKNLHKQCNVQSLSNASSQQVATHTSSSQPAVTYPVSS